MVNDTAPIAAQQGQGTAVAPAHLRTDNPHDLPPGARQGIQRPPVRPVALPVQPEHIPDDLRQYAQCVLWRYELRDNKWTKVPYDPKQPTRKASPTDPATWGDFDQTIAIYQRGKFDGIGLVLTPDNGLVGIDLDHCRDAKTGQIFVWAAEIVGQFKECSYIEISPSGEGLRIWTHGQLPDDPQRIKSGGQPGHGRKQGDIEIYQGDRYLTLTGHTITDGEMCAGDSQVERLYREVFPPVAPPTPRTTATPLLSDHEILQRAFRAANGPKVQRLYNGDISDFPKKDGTGYDQSAADESFCSCIAFWTDDPQAIVRIWQSSALWGNKAQGRKNSYALLTATRAIQFVTTRYTGTPKNGTATGDDRPRTRQRKKDTDAATTTPARSKAPRSVLKQEIEELRATFELPEMRKLRLLQAGMTLGKLIAQGELEYDEVSSRLLSVCLDVDLGEQEAKADIKRGLDKGMELHTEARERTQTTPVIETNNRQLRDKLKDVQAAVKRANHPPKLFHGDDGLVIQGKDKNGSIVLRKVTREGIQLLMSEGARWRSTSEKFGSREITPPRDLADQYLSLTEWPGVPSIDGIATAPIVSVDGTICAESGYHPSSRLYMALPPDFIMPSTEPTQENANKAKTLILDTLLGEVAFADLASRAHAVALMILPFVRQLIPGPTPLHLFDAPTQSSGKSYAAGICIAPFTTPLSSSIKGEEEEWRKSIMAALLAGRSHIFYDNVKGRLDSPTLAAALTQPSLTERAMGGMKEVTAKVRCVWVATSNNASLDSDAASRTIVIRLDTQMETPESRMFNHDPLQFIQHHRGQAIGAILTLVRLWQQAGCPHYKGTRQSRFSHWQNIVGGILQTAGIDGFLENLDDYRKSLDPEKAAWCSFIDAWYEVHQQEYVTAGDLLPLVSTIPEIAAFLGETETQRKQRMGKLLSYRKDKVISNKKITTGVQTRFGSTYRLIPLK